MHTHNVSSHLSLKRKIKISPAEHYFPFTSRVKYNRNNASISRQTFPFLRENGEAGTYYTTRPVPSYVFFLAWASRSPKDATISRASMRETRGDPLPKPTQYRSLKNCREKAIRSMIYGFPDAYQNRRVSRVKRLPGGISLFKEGKTNSCLIRTFQ